MMENTYGIGVTNRYQLFLDIEDDLLEVPSVQEQEKEVRKKTKPSEKEIKNKPEAKGKLPHAPRKSNKETQNLKSQNVQKPKQNFSTTIESVGLTGNCVVKNNDENCDDWTSNIKLEEKPVGDYHREPDKASDNVNQQSADQSGDWSTEKIVPDQVIVDHDEKQDPEPIDTGLENKETTTSHVVEEEPKEMTLDEYRALKGARQKPQYNLRKAGEGEDPSQWQKIYALEKKKDFDEENLEEEEYDRSDYPQRVGRQKHWFGIEIHFADNVRTPGRGRGGRGMGRGRPRGGLPRSVSYKGQVTPSHDLDSRTSQQIAPKVDDENDFPSLG